MRLGRILTVLMIFAALAAGWWLTRDRDAGPRYLTTEARRGDVIDTVMASGVIEASTLVSVGAQVSGRIVKLHVDVGQSVKAGALIAEIDSLPQRNAVSDATANLAALTAERAAQQARLKLAEQDDERQQTLVRTRAVSPAAADNARATLDAARADLARLDAQITRGQIALDKAKIDLGYTRIAAPISGVVVAVSVEEGWTVNAQQTTPQIVKLAVLDPVTVVADIAEADVLRLTPGMIASFTLMGDEGEETVGRLESIDPMPPSALSDSTTATDEAVYFKGRFEVENTSGRLRPGMTATVRFTVQAARKVIVIPSIALDRDKDGDFVRVPGPDGKPQRRAVKPGLDNRAEVEIHEGLAEGEAVITGEPVAAAAAPQGPPMRMRL